MATSEKPAAPDCIHSRAGIPVDRIVIHAMDGTFNGTIAWFQTPGRPVPTAAHYLVSRAGDICQMVPDDRMCFHAGSHTEPHWNERSIGIEHEVEETTGAHFPRNDWTDAMLQASAKVTAAMCRKFGIPVDRQHILGHVEVPGVTHVDPGPAFPWDRYMDLVRAA